MQGFGKAVVIGSVIILITAGWCGATMEMARQAGVAGQPEAPKVLSGKVVETMDSGGYTYVQLEKDGKKTWVAIPKLFVTVGQELELQPGTEMGEFFSKPLNRKFPTIIFSNGPVKPPMKESAAEAEMRQKAHQSVGVGGGKVDALLANIKVEKAAGPDAYTVEELYLNRDRLVDKAVSIRGKIVKANKGIMGLNWFHLRDGSGDGGKGTNNMVVTAPGNVSALVGDTVTVRGTLHKNRDFGGGYFYDVIVEDVSFIP